MKQIVWLRSESLVLRDDHHCWGVSVVPFLDETSNIDVDGVTLLKGTVVRNAMTHNIVHRGAHWFGETHVADRGRVSILRDNRVMHYSIDILGCRDLVSLNCLDSFLECSCRHSACFFHARHWVGTMRPWDGVARRIVILIILLSNVRRSAYLARDCEWSWDSRLPFTYIGREVLSSPETPSDDSGSSCTQEPPCYTLH